MQVGMAEILDTSFDWHEAGLRIGEVSRRSGVAPSALRFYERRGLISTERAEHGERRYHADVLCRVTMIRACQRAGLTLADIADALAELPEGRVPGRDAWERLAARLRHEVGERLSHFESVLRELAPVAAGVRGDAS